MDMVIIETREDLAQLRLHLRYKIRGSSKVLSCREEDEVMGHGPVNVLDQRPVVLKKGSGGIRELVGVINLKTQVYVLTLPQNDESGLRFYF
jgi:hypothetical protein